MIQLLKRIFFFENQSDGSEREENINKVLPVSARVVSKDEEYGAVREPEHDIAPVSSERFLVCLPVIFSGDPLVDRVRYNQK